MSYWPFGKQNVYFSNDIQTYQHILIKLNSKQEACKKQAFCYIMLLLMLQNSDCVH